MQKVIVIMGPTGLGKSELSIKLAKKYNLEVISGDSVQVYRSLDIGSAKITKEEMDGVKHYLIDILDPTEQYSVSDFQKEARESIKDIAKSGSIPLICGGTGFYLKACLYDYNFISDKRTDEFDKLSNEEIYKRLEELNDKEIPDVHNRKRLLRHLEILSSTVQTYNKDKLLYDQLLICLTMPREMLYERLDKRVDKMIDKGLVDEVKGLYSKGLDSYAMLSIGYKEIIDYLKDESSLEDTISLIKQHTRNFAKRQITYFKNQFDDVHYVDITKEDPFIESSKLIDEFIKK